MAPDAVGAGKWWKEGVCYQIWPASYKDSNDDGIGDIPGIIPTLDYLKWLGVDIVWLSPMYQSPLKDYGYDISDYEAIDERFGTMQDMDRLLAECHRRGIKLILDLVINHTSDLHRWFVESRKSKTGPYADWYIWKDPKVGPRGEKLPPNNWASIFGGSAWEYVPERGQYYLHLFATEQPDLNWENPETRRGIYDSAIEFWLKKGLDGFRIDTANLYSKVPGYADAPMLMPGQVHQPASDYYVNGPRIHEFYQEMHREAIDKYSTADRDIFLVGECAHGTEEDVLKFVSAKSSEMSCLFDFEVAGLGGMWTGGRKRHQLARHTLPELKQGFARVQNMVNRTDAWGTVFLENHDLGRSLARFATEDPRWRARAAKMLSIMLCCLTGTLFVYQGEEIGMTNVPTEWGPEYIRDIASLNYLEEMKKRYKGDPKWMRKALAGIRILGRDNARLPVSWSPESPNAGFTSPTAKPWIPVHPDHTEFNVTTEKQDPASPLNFWRQMIALRKQFTDLTVYGGFDVYELWDQEVFTFVKTTGGAHGGEHQKESTGKRLLVLLNFSDEEQPWEIPPEMHPDTFKGNLLVSNVEEREGEALGALKPWEGRVYLVE